VEDALTTAVIKRDWLPFVQQLRRLGLGPPERDGVRIDVFLRPQGTEEHFRAVLQCDGYDAQAPLLDFADPNDGSLLGPPYWPKMASAPMNSIEFEGRQLPIICTPGTRGYHLHSSHAAESHSPSIWRLPRVASLLARFVNKMGPYQGRGL